MSRIRRSLLAFDFDGTAAMTFELGPDGIGVHEACAMTVDAIFGDRGLRIYQGQGGLMNRAPIEVVSSLLEAQPRLIRQAHRFYTRHSLGLNGFVPADMGCQLDWETDRLCTIAELFVRQKLAYLMKQIGEPLPDGQPWPRPTRGFRSFWESACRAKADGWPIDLAIISSGHHCFIERTFNAWSLPLPDIIVTDDSIRGQLFPIDPERRVKPALFPYLLARRQWHLRCNGDGRQDERSRVIYFGDDRSKDGAMAQAAKIPFGWFNPSGHLAAHCEYGFPFRDWRTIADHLERSLPLLEQGESLGELILAGGISAKQLVAA